VHDQCLSSRRWHAWSTGEDREYSSTMALPLCCICIFLWIIRKTNLLKHSLQMEFSRTFYHALSYMLFSFPFTYICSSNTRTRAKHAIFQYTYPCSRGLLLCQHTGCVGSALWKIQQEAQFISVCTRMIAASGSFQVVLTVSTCATSQHARVARRFQDFCKALSRAAFPERRDFICLASHSSVIATGWFLSFEFDSVNSVDGPIQPHFTWFHKRPSSTLSTCQDRSGVVIYVHLLHWQG
jgi:hypothetical protein